jgi:hypothetical protein
MDPTYPGSGGKITAMIAAADKILSLAEEVADVMESTRAVSKQLGLRKEFPHPEEPSHCPRQKIFSNKEVLCPCLP